jgi:hypothetical protein
MAGVKPITPHDVTNNVKNSKRQRSAGTPKVELIVRRGALRRFDKLKRATAELPVKLSWDRRLGERRTAAGDVSRERRQSDRRKKPPFTWGTAVFVVVERPARESARGTAKSKRR